jgi:thioredoxin 1
MNKLYLVFLVIFVFSNYVKADPAIIVNSLEDAVVLSESTDYNILIVFGAKWCHYCVKSKEEVHNNISKYENIILLYVDVDSNKQLKKEYDIKLLPTYLLLKDREEIKRKAGYLSSDKILLLLNNSP